MKLKVVKTLPPEGPGGRRESHLAEVVRMAAKAEPNYIEVTDEAPDALNKTYKAMIQYRLRHPELGIQLRKQGDRFYVWIDAADEGVRHNKALRAAEFVRKEQLQRSKSSGRSETPAESPLDGTVSATLPSPGRKP